MSRAPARSSLSVVALLALVVSGCGPPEEPEPEPNEPPIARATWPQRWPADEAVPLDASASEDVDGRLVRVSALFGDGTYEQTSAAGRFEHVYGAPGSYDLRVEVEDDDGGTAELVGRIVIVERVEEPACSCALPCLDEGVCTDRGCFLSGVSEDVPAGFEGAPQPGGALACP